ncbi:ribosome-associated translation inhibitor RaiA [Candidatus Dojkabacteria bacterium]|nr:ribosome-associated translation inhibitor RaiA [Candidatus Dojkabacteria bacterium]
MALPEIKVSGHGMEITDAIKDYVEDKISKYEKIFDIATSISVECSDNVTARGVDRDFSVEIMMHLPNVIARVEKSGPELYALVDEVTDILVRKVKKYKETKRKWEGSESWKAVEMTEDLEPDTDIEEDRYVAAYVPKIVRRKKLEDCTPVTEAEAIERMEMLDYDSYLFKNANTGKYSMVYRRRHGGYGVVEPCE